MSSIIFDHPALLACEESHCCFEMLGPQPTPKTKICSPTPSYLSKTTGDNSATSFPKGMAQDLQIESDDIPPGKTFGHIQAGRLPSNWTRSIVRASFLRQGHE